MKRIILFLTFAILLTSFAFAEITGSAVKQNLGAENSAQISTETQQENQAKATQIQNRIKAGEYDTENGKKLQIREHQTEGLKLEIGNANARTSMNITQEQVQNKTRLRAKLSNGNETEIKIMPDTASETALARLKLKVCSAENNCQIELKEVGQGKQARVAYEMKAKKQTKLFGLFRAQMQVQTQVDAENGEVIQTKKPWWAFLAKESDEENSEESENASAEEIVE